MLSPQSRDDNKIVRMATMDTTRLSSKGLAWNPSSYHMVPMDTTNAAVTSLDSKWTPRRHFSGGR